MEKYQKVKELGSGAYGVVWKAFNIQTREVVAIKKLKRKYYSWEECMKLIEVRSLCKMHHPNIVKLKEIIRQNDILYLVFEYMECSLYGRMASRMKPFSETEIRDICFQIFQGLAHMHHKGYFHRDLKPENILVSKDVIKIADLGQAREMNGEPPYTDYVTTRWYRSPEVLLQSRVYDSAVDMWAMGAIMVELFTLRPLFDGSSAADVMDKICSVIGSPTESTWSMGLHLAGHMNYRFLEHPGVHLSSVLPSASPDALNLIATLLSWHPCMRPTAIEALQHPFFHGCYHVPQPLTLQYPAWATSSSSSSSSIMTSLPIVFKMAMERELLKQTSLKSCANSSERVVPKEEDDVIHMLPENPFDF